MLALALSYLLSLQALAAAPEPVVGRPLGEDAAGDFGISGKEPLPNFHEVSTGVYRLGQPNAEGLRILASLGVRTVLSLRERVGEEEKGEAQRLGMRVESVPMSGILTPSFRAVDAALAVISDPAKRPIAVHCLHGRDRTGYTVAAWRVKTQDQDLDAAAREAFRYGCCPAIWKNLRTFLSEYSRR